MRRLAAIACLGWLAGPGCNPDATPWSWPDAAEPRVLPSALDLADPDEARHWSAGPDTTAERAGSGGLRVAPEPGAGGDARLFVARAFPLAPGQLGRVDIVTVEPSAALEVGVYIRGRSEPAYSVRATPHPDDPRLQTARFREGRWNHKPVQGLRIVAPGSGGGFTLVRVAVSSEKYAPVARPDPEADWSRAFEPTGPARNAVLIVADTLRADHLSLYGYPRVTTPHLEGLARYGVVFEAAWSQAACTFPSVNSLLTSQPVASFLGEPAARRRSLAGRGSVAARLSAAGWSTAAVSASWVVRATPSHHNDWGGGYAAGFDHFDEVCAGQSAACVNERAVGWLDERADAEAPFFLYLHYLDPHDPYRPPAVHERELTEPFEGAESTARGDPNPLAEIRYRGDGADAVPEADVQHLRDLYDEEIRFLDRQLFLLFEALRQRRLLATTVVVLASDHGESFLDHGHLKHCRSVFEDQVRTPLVLWAPGAQPATRRGEVVQNLDVLPTLLDWLDVAAGEPPPAGRSLRPLAGSTAAPQRTGLAYSAQGTWLSVSDGRFKWILNAETGVGRLFDLEADPDESADVARAHPAERERLARALARHAPDAADRARLSHAVERQLEALGYLEGDGLK
ncbi:MAG: sulfatase [Myxococcota bacterium]